MACSKISERQVASDEAVRIQYPRKVSARTQTTQGPARWPEELSGDLVANLDEFTLKT